MSSKTKKIQLRINKRNEESEIPKVSAADLPTLITEDHYNTLTEGDDDPFLFSQGIKFPIKANGDIYTEEFFESFLKRNADRPFPGDKYGHSLEWYARQATHFYQIGGEIRGNIAYFKFYVPPKTDSEENTSFIKDIKTNGIDLSLVSKVSYKYNEADREYYILSSEGAERNDAVGYGDGSMEQAVFNSKKEDIKESFGMDEILKKLNALRVEGELTIPELLRKLNAEKFLKTEEDEANLKVLNSLKSELGENPIEKAKELKEKVKANSDKVREAALTEAFGTKMNADGKTENLKRVQAESLLEGKEINADNIKEVRENPLFLAVAGKEADVTTKANSLDQGGNPAGSVEDSSYMEL